MNKPLAAPSILAGNHANLAASAKVAQETEGVEWLHLDIMDGHFVPNLTFGPATVAALRPDCTLYFDVHLMLDNPWEYIKPFADAGAENITIHIEPTYPVDQPINKVLETIRSLGCHCGITLNPGTPIDRIRPFVDLVDLVLIMTVQPGFGGQSFRKECLPKIETAKQWRKDLGAHYRIEVDGGVDEETGILCKQAGADTFVAGSAFYKAADKVGFVAALQA